MKSIKRNQRNGLSGQLVINEDDDIILTEN
jgi:hypothetical protein